MYSSCCFGNSDHEFLIDLEAFTRLKKLSWSGFRTEYDIITLQDCIKQVSHQLVELELDFYEWMTMGKPQDIPDDYSDKYFPYTILQLPPPSQSAIPPPIFPNLQVLSLEGIEMGSTAKEVAHAFDFGSLRSLKVRLCRGWEDFLLCGSRSNRPPANLKSLELYTTWDFDEPAESTLCEFLGSIQGLEQLAIYTASSSPSSASTLNIWSSVAQHHKSTLKAFVHHRREISGDDETYDNLELFFTSSPEAKTEFDDWINNPSKQLLDELVGLEFLGLCCNPELVVCIHCFCTLETCAGGGGHALTVSIL